MNDQPKGLAGQPDPITPLTPAEEKFVEVLDVWSTREEVLAELKALYAQMLSSQASCGMSMIMCFPKQDPTHFSLLLKQRHPQALVILAYYTVLLDLLDSRWWVNGWGSRVLRDIVCSLGDEWKSWIEWPVQTVLMKSMSPSLSMDATMMG